MEDNLIGVENYFSITLKYLGRREKPVLSPEGLTSVYLLSDSCMPPTHHSPTHHHHQLAGDSRREPSQGLGLPVLVLRKLKWTTLCLCVQILNYHFNLMIISYINFIGLPQQSTGQFKIVESYSFSAVEVRSLQSRGQKGQLFLEAQRKNLVHAFS